MNKVISILLTVSLLISSSITVFAENTSISSDGEVNITMEFGKYWYE